MISLEKQISDGAERRKKFDELKQKVVTYIKKQAQFIKNMFRKNEDEKE